MSETVETVTEIAPIPNRVIAICVSLILVVAAIWIGVLTLTQPVAHAGQDSEIVCSAVFSSDKGSRVPVISIPEIEDYVSGVEDSERDTQYHYLTRQSIETNAYCMSQQNSRSSAATLVAIGASLLVTMTMIGMTRRRS